MIKTEVDINQQLKAKISIALNYIFWVQDVPNKIKDRTKKDIR